MTVFCEVIGPDLCAVATWSSQYFLCLARGTGAREEGSSTTSDVGDQVAKVVDHLPIELVAALWLVDVCELRYADAASVAGVSRDELAARLHAARRVIALQLDVARPGS